MSWQPYDEHHKPTEPEYQYLADLLMWEKDDPRINGEDKDPLTLQAQAAFLPRVTRRGGSGGVTGWNGTTAVQKPF